MNSSFNLARIRRLLRSLWLSLLIAPIASPAAGAVWEDRNVWDADWEARYSAWITEQWTDDFLLDPKRPQYHGVAHDCSDVPYLARLIFAYENALPFVIHDAGAREKLSNRTKRFDGTAAGAKRIRAFIEYVIKSVSSKTLPDDTYPIALADIRPGDLFLVPGEHTYLVTAIRPHGVLEFVYSTTPTAAQSMLRQGSFPLYVPTDDGAMRDGYRRFRQPVDIDKPYDQISAFSTEQFQVAEAAGYEYQAFSDAVARALGSDPETPEQQADRLVDELCLMNTQRVRYVNDGVEFLQRLRKTGRQCMNEGEYRQYSTFHRDRRLTTQWRQLFNLYRGLKTQGSDSPTFRQLTAIFEPYEASPKNRADIARRCTVTVDGSNALDLIDLRRLAVDDKLEADPHADTMQRWGLGSVPFKSACRRYEDQ